ncbi:hypothetical protein BAMA_24555 [Bacillus manliponensis]|uniref:HPr domain-containing protein n=1 Tax=Bacillus manliponensis TaxID=574376 RepID=A0A073KA60_9BACI|nr:hypothetical protein [Bacillus manliponensis]KEK19178.1 hypothetical protein BAMA_24555 [Bacillus manliponensis]
MNTIHSTTITYSRLPTLKEIHHMYALITTFQSSVFISKSGLMTSIQSFATFVSFFLMLKERECVLFVFEGPDAKQALKTIFIK